MCLPIYLKTGSNATKYYFNISRTDSFRKIEWGYFFVLRNFNLKYAKSFLPFIRVFRVLDNNHLHFIWIYDPTLDLLYLIVERPVINIQDINFVRFIEEVHGLDLFFKDSDECLKMMYKVFDPLFDNLKHGQIVRWNMAKITYRRVKNSTRTPLIDLTPARLNNDRMYSSPVPYKFTNLSRPKDFVTRNYYSYYSVPFYNFMKSFEQSRAEEVVKNIFFGTYLVRRPYLTMESFMSLYGWGK